MKQKNKIGSQSIEEKGTWIFYVILAVLIVICVFPFIMVISASFSTEENVAKYGYSLIPREFSLDTYKFLIASKGDMIAGSFLMTLMVAIIGTVYSVTITTCFAWAVTQSKEDFYLARPLSFMAWFTTVFSGGILAWYILCTQYYGLKNNIYALFVPYGMSVMNMFILRGNFRSIPREIIESAKLDGASNLTTFIRIVLPLSRAGITTITMFSVLRFWNDFSLPQWLITKSKYMTMQKLLYNMLSGVKFLMQNDAAGSAHMTAPIATANMAVAVIALLPIICIYPFSFRYFIKGINLGGVKG